jgi:hypothetical protein
MSETKKKPTATSQKNIMLVESVFIDGPAEPVKNFIGIPMDDACPFLEIIFDPIKKILGIVSKHKKPQFHFMPKLDGNGFPKPNSNKAMLEQSPFAQERMLIDTYHEYYIREPKEIEKFLNAYIYNKDFNWKTFLD